MLVYIWCLSIGESFVIFYDVVFDLIYIEYLKCSLLSCSFYR